MKLEQWSLQVHATVYTAPEACTKRLVGVVYGHPKKADGQLVVTSIVKHAEGTFVFTASGSIYELGEPSADHLQQLAEAGISYDPFNPLGGFLA